MKSTIEDEGIQELVRKVTGSSLDEKPVSSFTVGYWAKTHDCLGCFYFERARGLVD